MRNSPEKIHTEPHSSSVDVLAFPASVAQQAFWYLELFQDGVTAFNVPMRFRLDGPLDIRVLEKSIHLLIARHEALRTFFAEDDGELLQVVSPVLEPAVPVIDLSHLSGERMLAETDRLGSVEACRPFKLSSGPLIRAEVLRLSPLSHILHFTAHHSVFDGLSMVVFTRELTAIYQDLSDGKQPVLEPLPIQYGDFSVWQHEFLKSPVIARQLDYWKRKLRGMRELDLPTDHPRPPVKSWNGDIVSRALPRDLTNRLGGIAADHGATLFHLQLAAFKILLQRYCDTTDIALGIPVTGRTRGELEPLIGVFVNSLILRTDLSENPSFGDFLEYVRNTVYEALENQELPFEHLVRELRPARNQGRNPLFQINFNHHKSSGKSDHFGGVTLSPMPSRSPGTIFDLHVFVEERPDGWHAGCDYSTDLFERETAERILGHYEKLLRDIADHPDRRIFDLEIISRNEEKRLTHDWAKEERNLPLPASLLTPGGPVYLLDSRNRLVPTGIPGRLHIPCETNASGSNTIDHPEFGQLHVTSELMRWTNSGNLISVGALETHAAARTTTATSPPASGAIAGGDTEKKLATIWCDLLDMSSVNPDHAFFSLGGHSLMALRLFSKIKREFNVTLPMTTLISNPTVRSLASQIEVGKPDYAGGPASSSPSSKEPGNLVTLSDESPETPLFCIHGGDGGVFFYRNLAIKLRGILPIHAIESLELGSSEAIVPTSVEETATTYIKTLLSYQDSGPFRLAGYSFGGVVAHEMACQLNELGHKVDFLGLFDTGNPAAPGRNYSFPERLGVFWRDHHDQPLGKRVSLLGSRFNEGVRTHRRIRRELREAMTSGPAEAYTDLRCIQVREENWRAMQAYKPRLFQGRSTLFKSTCVNDKVKQLPDYGWSAMAAGGLDIRPVTGHHLEIFDPEHIDSLAQALTSSLNLQEPTPA